MGRKAKLKKTEAYQDRILERKVRKERESEQIVRCRDEARARGQEIGADVCFVPKDDPRAAEAV